MGKTAPRQRGRRRSLPLPLRRQSYIAWRLLFVMRDLCYILTGLEKKWWEYICRETLTVVLRLSGDCGKTYYVFDYSENDKRLTWRGPPGCFDHA